MTHSSQQSQQVLESLLQELTKLWNALAVQQKERIELRTAQGSLGNAMAKSNNPLAGSRTR